MKEYFLQALAFTLILMSPVLLYAAFCLSRGLWDDAMKLWRKVEGLYASRNNKRQPEKAARKGA